jgi:hypothetical protein
VLSAIAPCSVQCQSPVGEVPPGRIETALAEALQRGEKLVVLRAPILMSTAVKSMEMVAKQYSVVVAEPVAVYVAADRDNVVSWYTLQIEEYLVRQQGISEDGSIPPPALRGGTDTGRVVVPVLGGEVSINGITVRQPPSNGITIQVGKKYVLILSLELGGAVGQTAAQAAGILRFNLDGTLASLQENSALGRELRSRWNGDLESLRAFLRQAQVSSTVPQ